MPRIQIYLAEAMHERLRARAHGEGISMSERRIAARYGPATASIDRWTIANCSRFDAAPGSRQRAPRDVAGARFPSRLGRLIDAA